MLVSFNPHSAASPSTIEVTSSGAPLSAPSRDISDFSSSITSYGSSTTGFFSWISEKLGEIWHSIVACFCPTETTSVEIPIEARVKKAEAIINRHFDRFAGGLFSAVNTRKSAIVVVIKYNNLSVSPLLGKVSNSRGLIKDKAKAQLRSLINHDGNRNRQDGLLEIKTFFIEKRENSFRFDSNKESLQFARIDRASQDHECMNDVSVYYLRGRLDAAFPSPEESEQVFDFVNRL